MGVVVVRRFVDRALPRGTRRRRLLGGALVIVRETRSAAVRTRAEWQRRRDERNRAADDGSESVLPSESEGRALLTACARRGDLPGLVLPAAV